MVVASQVYPLRGCDNRRVDVVVAPVEDTSSPRWMSNGKMGNSRHCTYSAISLSISFISKCCLLLPELKDNLGGNFLLQVSWHLLYLETAVNV